MHLTPYELLEVTIAITAILMLGSTNIRTNLVIFAIQTALLAALTVSTGVIEDDSTMIYVAISMFLEKSLAAPLFLDWIMHRIKIHNERMTVISAPASMHLGIVMLAISYLLAQRLPNLANVNDATMGSTASLALLLMGILMMLSRKLAISQVIGFLVLENGIYMYQLTQTRDMPLIIEMGILLDVLVMVMLAGVLLFRIQKSFEHIDVTQLTHLKD
jgi:hydrogenase-4 component E